MKAREKGLAGASVVKASMGFGKNSVLRSAKILTLSTNLPMLVEIVDLEDRIKAFLPELAKMGKLGLVTMEKVEVLRYEAGG
jgi:hypothetical protein